MQRYFIPEENWQEDAVIIDKSDAHHVMRVMRMTEGDTLICAHPNGLVALCSIHALETDHVRCLIDEWLDQTVELPVDVTIVQGLPKGDKMEQVLQKGTELGATGFIPFKADRSVVKWDDKKAHRKLLRYEKIVKEAAEQSHRTRLPHVYEPMDLATLLQSTGDYDVCIYAYEEEAKTSGPFTSLAAVFQELKPQSRLLVCIGPEGGFSPDEATTLKESGFIPVRTGPRILRTETAALYVLAALSYHLEELRCHS
ncbi:16S rRNA (uracil(1498)-N(3))-methyltransferase [Lentibacillus saliphilus]|uniref:16S rRNA (uracil(1498)-N(3))-methyltransferase n=1 Tax=Lentibacillus saliphilus TaxID=2737028 RepID=UPI001C308184